ncbi:hypothetical protein ACHAXA_006521 [Cyclostephanos tholiformis]|uniref:Uncharacterized protein n=1 Tax=Cyclostephanos tholiformis TaxID=382380 RepID=A0ABD3RL11_9STRA
MTEDEWRIAQREIDWNVESYFGYTPLDCHRCHGDSNAIGNILQRYAPTPIARGGMHKKGIYATTNELSPASPKGRGAVQRKTTQTAADNVGKNVQKRAVVRRSSAAVNSHGSSSSLQKGEEKSIRQKKRSPFSLSSRKERGDVRNGRS